MVYAMVPFRFLMKMANPFRRPITKMIFSPTAFSFTLTMAQVKRETVFVKGKPDGLVKEYYPDGKIKKEMHYKKGKPNGITRSFYENGKVETEAQL